MHDQLCSMVLPHHRFGCQDAVCYVLLVWAPQAPKTHLPLATRSALRCMATGYPVLRLCPLPSAVVAQRRRWRGATVSHAGQMFVQCASAPGIPSIHLYPDPPPPREGRACVERSLSCVRPPRRGQAHSISLAACWQQCPDLVKPCGEERAPPRPRPPSLGYCSLGISRGPWHRGWGWRRGGIIRTHMPLGSGRVYCTLMFSVFAALHCDTVLSVHHHSYRPFGDRCLGPAWPRDEPFALFVATAHSTLTMSATTPPNRLLAPASPPYPPPPPRWTLCYWPSRLIAGRGPKVVPTDAPAETV